MSYLPNPARPIAREGLSVSSTDGILTINGTPVTDADELIALQELVNDALIRSGATDMRLGQSNYSALVLGAHTPALRRYILAMPIKVGRLFQRTLQAQQRTATRAARRLW